LRTIELPADAPVHLLGSDATDAAACLAAGDAFLDAGDALVLRVPSVVVPQEWNMLLNVRHADMGRVKVVAADPFTLDPRLVG
jgi:RES domain-containing protein